MSGILTISLMLLKIPPNSFFFSVGVDSLYTNTDIQAGLGSIRKIFQRYPDPKRP